MSNGNFLVDNEDADNREEQKEEMEKLKSIEEFIFDYYNDKDPIEMEKAIRAHSEYEDKWIEDNPAYKGKE